MIDNSRICIKCIHKEVCYRYRLNYIGAREGTCTNYYEEPKKGEWIPVSERLPEKSDKYWCTFGGTNLTGIDYYTTKSDAKKLFDEPEECIGWQSQNVIAWQPLPEPYIGGDKND